jgi:hypothetical protein
MAGRWDNSDLAALIARDAKLRHYELPPEQGQDEKDRPDIKAEGGGEGARGEDTIEYPRLAHMYSRSARQNWIRRPCRRPRGISDDAAAHDGPS